jgi:indolepyruvate ferredoxin oxidoreductase alpha subunit
MSQPMARRKTPNQLGTNYFKEIEAELPVKPSQLHIAVYPVPTNKIEKLAKSVDRILIFEEGYPFIEKQLRSVLNEYENISGKMDGYLPASGELDADVVRRALALEQRPGVDVEVGELPPRPPQLCKGCPHIDTFNAINEAIKDCDHSLVTSDIGCYSLGALPPYSAIESILCMGASIGTATGAIQAGLKNVIATIGDSTFLHSGITPLLDAVSANTNLTVIIMDNSTTAMTGGQDTVLTSPQKKELVKGLGVSPEHVRVIVPLKKHTEENAKVIREELSHEGASVIIAQRECIQTLKQHRKEAE